MLLLGKHGYRKTRKHGETEPDDYIPFREREEEILTLDTNNGTSSFIDLIMPMRDNRLSWKDWEWKMRSIVRWV